MPTVSSLCFSSRGQNQPHHWAIYTMPIKAHFPAARWVQTRLLQYKELHIGLSFSLLTTVKTMMSPPIKKKQLPLGFHCNAYLYVPLYNKFIQEKKPPSLQLCSQKISSCYWMLQAAFSFKESIKQNQGTVPCCPWDQEVKWLASGSNRLENELNVGSFRLANWLGIQKSWVLQSYGFESQVPMSEPQV